MISNRGLTGVLLGALALSAWGAGDADAQALPSPRAMAAGLDVECYKTPGESPNIPLNLTHLNPVLLQLGLQPTQVIVRELSHTCVPVRKNNTFPGPLALPYVRHVDFACYRLEANPLANPQPLNLTHLNPVLANLPVHNVVLEKPAHLCVPVAKNGILPPAAVLAVVQYLDLLCYDADPQQHPQFNVLLSQLNPQLQNIAPHNMTLTQEAPRQLCVPVRKNNQFIPAPALARIQWIDLERFKAQPNVVIAPVSVILQHLNPLLVGQPQFKVSLETANSLMVPVAKNGQLPPD